MKKLQNLGAALTKKDQKEIIGGRRNQQPISGSSAQCYCIEGGNDGWDGSISSCARCSSLCDGEALCVPSLPF